TLTFTEGECPKPCPARGVFCIEKYEPVCGSDGKTYSNQCFFNKAACDNKDLTVSFTGECPAPPTQNCSVGLFCIDKYEPVCGSDGKTYGNKCFFDKANCLQKTLTFTEGECPKPCPARGVFCIEKYEPVCGSDGKTYSNQCFFDKAACDNKDLTVSFTGECPKPPAQACGALTWLCTKEYKPVCASDKKTYNNNCLFEKAKCANKNLKIVKNGRC
ncbi:hypothetical protein HDU97_007716, partial [Phlyctochytrium planicorne]